MRSCARNWVSSLVAESRPVFNSSGAGFWAGGGIPSLFVGGEAKREFVDEGDEETCEKAFRITDWLWFGFVPGILIACDCKGR